MPISIVPESREHWLQLKSEDVSSTEVAALFDLSPYLTKLELHYIKAGKTAVDFEASERMVWGNRLEAAIAEGVAADYGLKIRKVNRYMRHDKTPRMGSSFDFEIVGVTIDGVSAAMTVADAQNPFQRAYLEHGAGILEIKNVDGFIYKQQWQEEEAPSHIETQVQHQLEVVNREWVMICPLVGGNNAKPFVRLRDQEVGKAMCDAVNEFWAGVDSGIDPEPDFERDADFIIRLHQSAGVEAVVIDDAHVRDLMVEYKQTQEQISALDKHKDAVKAEILHHVGDDVGKVVCGQFTLSCAMTKDTPATLITPEMVGQTYGGRKGYRNFRISAKVEK